MHIMNVQLDLPVGKWRDLSKQEIGKLIGFVLLPLKQLIVTYRFFNCKAGIQAATAINKTIEV